MPLVAWELNTFPHCQTVLCVCYEHREARPDISSIIVKRRMKKDFWHATTVTHDTPLPLPHTRLPHFWVQLYQIWQCVCLSARDSHFLSQFWRIVRHGIFPCSFEYMQGTLAYGIILQLASKAQVSPKNVARTDQMLPLIMSDKK